MNEVGGNVAPVRYGGGGNVAERARRDKNRGVHCSIRMEVLSRSYNIIESLSSKIFHFFRIFAKSVE